VVYDIVLTTEPVFSTAAPKFELRRSKTIQLKFDLEEGWPQRERWKTY
jgi:hypothetical protein